MLTVIIGFRLPAKFEAKDTDFMESGITPLVPPTRRFRGKRHPPEATFACRTRPRTGTKRKTGKRPGMKRGLAADPVELGVRPSVKV
jgi:hypothetical protein